MIILSATSSATATPLSDPKWPGAARIALDFCVNDE
jgi:hypothetical protein